MIHGKTDSCIERTDGVHGWMEGGWMDGGWMD